MKHLLWKYSLVNTLDWRAKKQIWIQCLIKMMKALPSQQQLLQTFFLLKDVLPIGEIYILAFDKESSVRMNSSRIFGTIATQSSFWPFIARPTGPPLERRKGMQDGSHASQAWLKAAPGSRPITRKWNGQNGTQAGHTIKNQRLPCARLYRDLSPPQHPRRSCWTQQTVPWTRTGWGGRQSVFT